MPTPSHTAEYISLRDYIDTRLEAMNKATDMAYKEMDRRLSSMNEFRDSLKDQSNTFFTKAEQDLYREKIEGEIRALREYKAVLESKASQSAVNLSTALSFIGLLLGVISLILHFIE